MGALKKAFKSYFLQHPVPVCRGAYIPYFKISPPIFFCPLFSENYLNPQVRINKMVNKHIVNYHLSPLQLISRIHSLIFLSYMLLSLPPQAEGNYPFLQNRVFSRSIFPQQKRGGGRIMALKKLPKLNLLRVLVTSFDKFHHLCNLYIFRFCFVVP